MDVTPDDFRRHFDSLSDEALLDINPAELVEAAREAYVLELANRDLDQEQAEPAAPETESDSPELLDLVSIGSYPQVEEASLARALLESAGIPSRFSNDRLLSKYYPSAGMIELLVPKDLAEEAIQILNSELSEDELAAQAEEAGEPD